MAKALKPANGPAENGGDGSAEKTGAEESSPATADNPPEELVSKRFATLLTVNDNANIEEEYNNSAIRGKIQDRNLSIEPEPWMMLSFYSSPTELRRNTYYIREIDDLNATRALRFVIMVTNAVPAIDESIAERHFRSIEYYNSYLATHSPRAADYIGRAMDFLTVRDYPNAEKDIDRAIALMPDYAPAYLLRAQARHSRYLADRKLPAEGEGDALTRATMRRKALDDILADLDRTIELSPGMAMAWYNKGNLLYEAEDYEGATEAYSRAIELKPDFGEAYYNRGFLHLKAGRRALGIDDLGKAGEYGIVPAYNLIKRISR